MFVQAAANFISTAQGTRLVFDTTVTGTMTTSTKMTVDPLGNLGIGTIAPSAAVEVVRETGTRSNYTLRVTAGRQAAGEPKLLLRTARGTAAAPIAIQDGDELRGFGVTGFGTTGFGEFNAAGASCRRGPMLRRERLRSRRVLGP